MKASDLLAPFRNVASAPARFVHNPGTGRFQACKGAYTFAILGTSQSYQPFGLARWGNSTDRCDWFVNRDLFRDQAHPLQRIVANASREIALASELGLPELNLTNFKKAMALIPSLFRVIDANAEQSLTDKQAAALRFIGGEWNLRGRIALELNWPFRIIDNASCVWSGPQLPGVLSTKSASIRLEIGGQGLESYSVPAVTIDLKPTGHNVLDTMKRLNVLDAAGFSQAEAEELLEFCEANDPRT